MSNELGFHLWMRKARLMGPPICTLTIQQGRAGLLTVHGNKPRSITHYHTHTHTKAAWRDAAGGGAGPGATALR